MSIIKHIEDFEHDDNLRGGFVKHIIVEGEQAFEEGDNFLVELPKHILDFEKDDNFRGI